MPQLPLFGDAPQTHPPARSIARPVQPRSRLSKTTRQQPLLALPAAPIAPVDRPLLPAPPSAKGLPPSWVDPSDRAFNYLKNCRLCGAPIKTGGLDHSLCSADCGWVIDLIWQAQQQQRKRPKEPEPQATTHPDRGESEALNLFSDGLNRDTSEMDGGAA